MKEVTSIRRVLYLGGKDFCNAPPYSKELKMLHTEQLHDFCGFENSEMVR